MHKLFFLEDETSIMRILKRTFDGSDYDLRYATTGEEAINILDSFVPDLVVLDLMLPGELSGIDVLLSIRSKPLMQNTKVIILTAKTEQNMVRSCYDLGCTDFVRKPFVETEFKSKVDIYLDLKSTKALNVLNTGIIQTLRNMVKFPVGTICGFADILKENRNLPELSSMYGLTHISDSGKEILNMLGVLTFFNEVTCGEYKFNKKFFTSQSMYDIFDTMVSDININIPTGEYLFDKKMFEFIVSSILEWLVVKPISVNIVGIMEDFTVCINTNGFNNIEHLLDPFDNDKVSKIRLHSTVKAAVAYRCINVHGGVIMTDGRTLKLNFNSK